MEYLSHLLNAPSKKAVDDVFVKSALANTTAEKTEVAAALTEPFKLSLADATHVHYQKTYL